MNALVKNKGVLSYMQWVCGFKKVLTFVRKFAFCQACGKSVVAQLHYQVTWRLDENKHISVFSHLNVCLIGNI